MQTAAQSVGTCGHPSMWNTNPEQLAGSSAAFWFRVDLQQSCPLLAVPGGLPRGRCSWAACVNGSLAEWSPGGRVVRTAPSREHLELQSETHRHGNKGNDAASHSNGSISHFHIHYPPWIESFRFCKTSEKLQMWFPLTAGWRVHGALQLTSIRLPGPNCIHFPHQEGRVKDGPSENLPGGRWAWVLAASLHHSDSCLLGRAGVNHIHR